MPSGRTIEIPTPDVLSALENSISVINAAERLGCTAPDIHWRARKDSAIAKGIQMQSQRREDRLAELIHVHRGAVSKIAAELGVGAANVRHLIRTSPTLRAEMAASREKIVDKAEENIFDAVESGNLPYSWKLLNTLGKERGYTERKEVDTQVTHRVDSRSTGELLSMLEGLARTQPEVVEAEFQDLSDEDRELISGALAPAQGAE